MFLCFAAGSLTAADLAANAAATPTPYYILAVAALVFAIAGLAAGALGAWKTNGMTALATSSLAGGLNAMMVAIVIANDLFLHGRI